MINMLNETELRILSAFFPEGKERTTREIEEGSGYSHERAYSTLGILEKKGVLSKRKVGKALVYSINKFDDVVYLAFAYYSINRKNKFINQYPSVWKAVEDFMNTAKPEMVILFGSYSKGEAKERSDVDLLCVNGASEAEKIALSLRHEYNIRITPVVVKKEDFRNIKRDNAELWDDVIKFGVILKGQELFYDLVYRGAA